MVKKCCKGWRDKQGGGQPGGVSSGTNPVNPASMKIDIDSVNSLEIREEYRATNSSVAIYLGRYEHPEHKYSNDWHVYLYDVCGQLAFATNGNAVWEECGEDFASLVAVYGIDLNAAREEGRA